MIGHMAKDTTQLYPYAAAAVSSVLIVLIAWQLAPLTGTTSSYLFFILAITINSWLGGLKYGLFITAVSTITAILFFLFANQPHGYNTLVFTFEALLFTLVGITISFIIEKYKNTNEVLEYRKKNKALLHKFEEMDIECTKMREEIRMRDEFLSIASHELKTPLTSMLLKIQMLLHNIRNVSLAQFSVENLLKQLETAEEQTKRLSRMISDLLNVSLITTGKLNLEPSTEDLRDIVKEVASEFSEKMQKDGYEFTLDAPESIPMQIDKVRTAQVITNLISNAIRYGDGKPIDVKVKRVNSTAQIIVRDNGLGIDENQHAKIFQLFERGEEKNGIKGLGVGLYISNQIVKAHGGAIKVKSVPNSGSTFTIELPIVNTP